MSADHAAALRALGESKRRHDPAAARAAYEEAVDILRREGGDPLRLAHTVRHLGDVCHEQGDNAGAAPCYDEALAIYRARPDARPLDVANAARSAAVLKQETGQLGEARVLWTEALRLYRHENIEPGIAESTRRLEMLTP